MMPHILVICTANICRSPVVEAILREKLAKEGLTPESGWTVSSAGTWALIARSPAHYSQLLMAERGLDIGDKRAQMVTEALMIEADLVLCMETGHVEALQAEFPDHRRKIRLLSEVADRRYSISDPYGQSIVEFQAMVSEVESLIVGGFEQIVGWAMQQAQER